MYPILRQTESNSISLTALKPGSYPFELVLDDEFFAAQSGEILSGHTAVHAVLNLRADDYDLRLAVEGEVAVMCDRCLEPMTLPIAVEEEFFSPDEDGIALDEDHQLDIAWLAYESIIVHLPLVHSHQPGGCNPEMDALLHNHLCADGNPED